MNWQKIFLKEPAKAVAGEEPKDARQEYDKAKFGREIGGSLLGSGLLVALGRVFPEPAAFWFNLCVFILWAVVTLHVSSIFLRRWITLLLTASLGVLLALSLKPPVAKPALFFEVKIWFDQMPPPPLQNADFAWFVGHLFLDGSGLIHIPDMAFVSLTSNLNRDLAIDSYTIEFLPQGSNAWTELRLVENHLGTGHFYRMTTNGAQKITGLAGMPFPLFSDTLKDIVKPGIPTAGWIASSQDFSARPMRIRIQDTTGSEFVTTDFKRGKEGTPVRAAFYGIGENQDLTSHRPPPGFSWKNKGLIR